MARFEWKKKYEVGHRFIDMEHQVLFEIANELAENGFSSVQDFKRKYVELIEYCNLHFMNEEAVMRSIGYSNLEIHHRKHQDIIAEMKSLLGTASSLERVHRNLVTLVSKWIVTHIEQEDMAYKPLYHEWKRKKVG